MIFPSERYDYLWVLMLCGPIDVTGPTGVSVHFLHETSVVCCK
jgi:hypothetical protein